MDKDIKVSMRGTELYSVQYPSSTGSNIWYGRAIVDFAGHIAIVPGMMFDDEDTMMYISPMQEDWFESEEAALNSSTWKWTIKQEGACSLCPR